MTKFKDIIYIDDMLFLILEYLNFKDIISMKKTIKINNENINKNSENIFRTLVKNLNYKILENKNSISFHKNNYTISITKTNKKNYFEKALKLSLIHKNMTIISIIDTFLYKNYQLNHPFFTSIEKCFPIVKRFYHF